MSHRVRTRIRWYCSSDCFLGSPARRAYVRPSWMKVRIASIFCQGARREDRMASRSSMSCGMMLSRSSILWTRPMGTPR